MHELPLDVRSVALIAFMILATFLGAGRAGAATVTVTNSATITIPGLGDSGIASPFPSTISVSGVSGVTDVDVILHGLSHTYPLDLDIALEGPLGQKVILMDERGNASSDWLNNTVTFSDGGIQLSPGSSTTPGADGTYAPSGLVNCPLLACTGGGSLLSVYNGLDPTGTWKLSIYDDQQDDAGSIANGWSLQFTSAVTVVPLPPAALLFACGLLGLIAIARRQQPH
ncbi:MAG: proprotein convertase P-domain-containing protein [Thiogranum sp.]|nr:proprotein convertase P-domain-containing protein [Thiogranum sp.]